MEAILLAASPVVVSLVTQLVKKLGAVDIFTSDVRKVVLRFVVAAFSFLAVVLGALVAGDEVDPVAIDTFVKAAMVFLGAIIPYGFGSSR